MTPETKKFLGDVDPETLAVIAVFALTGLQCRGGFDLASGTILDWLGGGVTLEGCELLRDRIQAHIADLERCEAETR